MVLTTIEFTKDSSHLDQAHGEIKQGLYSGTEIFFNSVKDMRDEYDTNQISSFSFDIDMEIFDAMTARLEEKISDKYSVEDMVMDIVKKMKKDENKKTPEHVLELADQGYEVNDIAEETGYTRQQVYNILRGQ